MKEERRQIALSGNAVTLLDKVIAQYNSSAAHTITSIAMVSKLIEAESNRIDRVHRRAKEREQ